MRVQVYNNQPKSMPDETTIQNLILWYKTECEPMV